MSNQRIKWDRPAKCRIGVIGDLILDEYLSGSVQRISPEAPVPVHLVQKSSHTAGGAANVARNIYFAGGDAALHGFCGTDQDGDRLVEILSEDGIETAGILRDQKIVTIKKTRITSNRQQLLRIDWESTKAINVKQQDLLFTSVKEAEVSALLVSDYGKGCLPDNFLSSFMKYALDEKIKVLVDPKGHNYEKYRGAFLITPNWKEACEALGIDMLMSHDPKKVAIELRDKFGIRNVVVTLGERGMVGARESDTFESVIHFPAETREVFDVSGAGDTVVAVLALAIGSGSDLTEAMWLANVAAGLVVEKWGTQPVMLGELKAALEGDVFRSASKICSLEGAMRGLGKRGNRDRRIVFTNGCFDLLHAGHVSYLEKARARGDFLVVGVNSDESVARLKGPKRPIVPLEQRLSVIAGLGCVDMVVAFHEDTPRDIIDGIEPDVLVKGADYTIEQIVGADSVLKGGGAVETIDFVEGLSTSSIISKALD